MGPVRPSRYGAGQALAVRGRSGPRGMVSPRGSVPERPKGADCKSAGTAYEGSNPSRPTLPPSTPCIGRPDWARVGLGCTCRGACFHYNAVTNASDPHPPGQADGRPHDGLGCTTLIPESSGRGPTRWV